MPPRQLLRAEGFAVFALALATYVLLDGPLWLFLVLALAPDVSMAGYLAGPRVGALAYNVVHTYVLPLTLAAYALWSDARLALLAAVVWAGHVGADRAIGYGLKYDDGFEKTHLSPDET